MRSAIGFSNLFFPGPGFSLMVWFSPEAVAAVQSALAPLEPLWLVLTRLGDGPLYIVAVGLLLWCVDKRAGFRLGMLLLVSTEVNVLAKEGFGAPRPPAGLWRDPLVSGDPGGGGFGLPSGHAQAAGVFWGGLALRWRRRWFIGFALSMVAGVSLSRVALGVHFPGDVAAGLALAGGLLLLDRTAGSQIADTLRNKPLRMRFSVAAVPGLVGLVALAWRPTADLAGAAGLLLGLPLGYVAETAWVGSEPARGHRERGLRFGVGALVMVGVGAALAFGRETLPGALASNLGLALAATLLAPWVFRRIKI